MVFRQVDNVNVDEAHRYSNSNFVEYILESRLFFTETEVFRARRTNSTRLPPSQLFSTPCHSVDFFPCRWATTDTWVNLHLSEAAGSALNAIALAQI